MDLEIIIISVLSQEKTNTIWYHLYMESKYETNKLIYETETGSQTYRTDLWLPRMECGRGMDREFGVSGCELSDIVWLNNKILLYGTGNYIQHPVINHNGKKYERECIYFN